MDRGWGFSLDFHPQPLPCSLHKCSDCFSCLLLSWLGSAQPSDAGALLLHRACEGSPVTLNLLKFLLERRRTEMTHFHSPVYMNASFKSGNTQHPLPKHPPLHKYGNIFRMELVTRLIRYSVHTSLEPKNLCTQAHAKGSQSGPLWEGHCIVVKPCPKRRERSPVPVLERERMDSNQQPLCLPLT